MFTHRWWYRRSNNLLSRCQSSSRNSPQLPFDSLRPGTLSIFPTFPDSATVHHSRNNVTSFPLLTNAARYHSISRPRNFEWTTRVVTYDPVENIATKGGEGTLIRRRAENKACKRWTRAASWPSQVELRPSRGTQFEIAKKHE